MTRLSNRLFLLVITIFTLIYIQSCEKDFTSIDSDVINSENAINFDTKSIDYPIVTHSTIVDPVQSNNLPSFLIGYNNHPIYGGTTSNFVGQMVPDQYSPDFGENPVLDSVILLYLILAEELKLVKKMILHMNLIQYMVMTLLNYQFIEIIFS